MSVDITQFKNAIESVCEVEINFTELIQNITINSDGNIESHGDGIHVCMTLEYEIVWMGGGITQKMSDMIMNDKKECL
jgi:hypothetical protein